MEKMVTKEWTKANSSDTGFFEFLTPSLVLVIIHVFHFTSKMFFAMGDDLSYGLNTLGPLCLWQCFFVLASNIIQALDSKPGSFNHTCISFHPQDDICHG